MKDNCLSCSQILRLLILAFIFALVSGCGGGSSNSAGSTEQASKTTAGVAQKGPFSFNSPVVISRLDSVGNPTGDMVSTKISASNGGFEFKLPEHWDDSNNVSVNYYIEVQGKTFDESSGTQSSTLISLTAYTQNINSTSVNLLTHWSAERTKKLLTEGKSFKQSFKQANDEIKEIFGISQINKLDISSPQFASDNAMLLLLSGALMEVARAYNAEAQLLIDEIADDFANNGELSATGDHWFLRMQAEIRDNPSAHASKYSKLLKEKQGVETVAITNLPAIIPLASRPVANVPSELFASPGETITLDGSASHDSGEIINFTWFRVDQQQQFVVPLSDRFSSTPRITVPSQESVLLFAVIVTDAGKLTDTAVIKVIVREPPPENNAPVADPQVDDQQVVTNEDTPVNITLTGSDPDSDTLNFIITTPLLLPNGLLEGTAPNLVYTPTQNFTGSDSFTFLVNDGAATSNVARVDILVLPVNDPPVADDKTVVTDEDTPVNISLTGSDIENDPLMFRIGSNTPANGFLSGATPNVVYTPGINFFGSDSFDYIANDGIDDSQPAIVNIIVNPVNDPPIANPQTVVTDEDTPVSITLTGSDIEGDSLSFNLGGITLQNGTLSGTPPNLTYIPDLDFKGDDSFNFTVNDGTDSSAAALVNIQVLPVDDNNPPIADAGEDITEITIETDGGPEIQLIMEGNTVQLDGSGSSDPDGDTYYL